MKKKEIEDRRKKIYELLKKGKRNSVIAKKLNISEDTLRRDLKAIKEGKLKKEVDLVNIDNIDIDELYGLASIPSYTLKKMQNYISSCKIQFKQNTLKKQEMERIKKIIMLTREYDDIVFYIRACIGFKMFKEAKYQVNRHINDEDLTKEQKEKMKKLKNEVQLTEQKYIALRALKNGKGIKVAQLESGLPEVEVLGLNRKYLSNKQKTTNDEDDELKK